MVRRRGFVAGAGGRPAAAGACRLTERRCIVTGEVTAPERLVRFVVSPEGAVVPDLAGELPGRGIWVRAERAALERAVAKRLFGRAARRAVTVEPDLASRVEMLLERRCLGLLGLACRAGQAVGGFEKVRERLKSGRVAVLLAARDGAADGRAKLARLAGALPLVEQFSTADLSLAMGRENVVHAALAPGRLADRFLAETDRLTGFRSAMEPPQAARSE